MYTYVPAKTRPIDFCCPDLFEARTRFFRLPLSLSLELTPAHSLLRSVAAPSLPWDMTSKAAAADGKRGRVTKLLLPVGTTKRETVARATGRAN